MSESTVTWINVDTEIDQFLYNRYLKSLEDLVVINTFLDFLSMNFHDVKLNQHLRVEKVAFSKPEYASAFILEFAASNAG